MKFLFPIILALSILGCDSNPPDSLIGKYKDSIKSQDLSKLRNLYAKGHYQCDVDTINFPDNVKQFSYELKSMEDREIEIYKNINYSEATKKIKFSEYLNEGLSYKEAGQKVFEYLDDSSNPRTEIQLKTLPSYQANITMQISQNSNSTVCIKDIFKKLTLYIGKFESGYKLINPMCDVNLATTYAKQVSNKYKETLSKKVDLDSLEDKYRNEGLIGIKNYAKENDIPEVIVLEVYNTKLCPSF